MYSELQKRVEYCGPLKWGSVQTPELDKLTNFIYHTKSWDELLKKVDGKDFHNYAINRWFNFWAAMEAEKLFVEYGAIPYEKKHPHIDFTIHGVPFDLKITHSKKPVTWLYDNASTRSDSRNNRLFLVLNKWSDKAFRQIVEPPIQKFMEYPTYRLHKGIKIARLGY